MSNRPREAGGERSSRALPVVRTNEYFVPKDGIDREVITADVCRYLGNDALVRPGVYTDPKTGARQEGYFITAYRNLTSAMIVDLKADSARWADERRQTQTRGQQPNGISSRDSNGMVRPSNTPVVEYRSSQIHQARQYYGPSGEPSMEPQGYGASQGYPQPSASTGAQGVYDPGPQYPSSSFPNSSGPYSSQPAPGYPQAQSYTNQNPYYSVAANLAPEQRPEASRSMPSGAANVQYGAQSYQSPQQPQGVSRLYSQPGPSPVSASAQYAHQEADPYQYGRAAPTATSYESPGPEMYDGRAYQPDVPGYSQPSMHSSSVAPSGSTSSHKRDREREVERDRRHRSHR
ncbi:hypothetical protein BJ878DRAFT_483718 [Calycina marina]|uniref:Transcription factor RfeG n=1 Tax=Calycina marina TaxID=1763456 RepID=A0A9P8CBG9_9HELO|nr:hypothetical protein BJ878DRAFT_483718 [Calycina marina]